MPIPYCLCVPISDEKGKWPPFLVFFHCDSSILEKKKITRTIGLLFFISWREQKTTKNWKGAAAGWGMINTEDFSYSRCFLWQRKKTYNSFCILVLRRRILYCDKNLTEILNEKTKPKDLTVRLSFSFLARLNEKGSLAAGFFGVNKFRGPLPE